MTLLSSFHCPNSLPAFPAELIAGCLHLPPLVCSLLFLTSAHFIKHQHLPFPHTAFIKITKASASLGLLMDIRLPPTPPQQCSLQHFSSDSKGGPSGASCSLSPPPDTSPPRTHPLALTLILLFLLRSIPSLERKGQYGRFCVSTISCVSLLPLLPPSCPHCVPAVSWPPADCSTQPQNQPTIHLESSLGPITSLLGVLQCSLHLQLLADELGAELATLGHLCLHLAESGLAHLYSLSLEELSADPPLGPSVSPPSLQTWRMCCLRHVMHHHLVSHVRNVLFTFWMNTRAEYRRAEACCDSLVPLFAL